MKHQDWGGYEGQVCVDPQEMWTGGREGCSWCPVTALEMRLGDWVSGNREERRSMEVYIVF